MDRSTGDELNAIAERHALTPDAVFRLYDRAGHDLTRVRVLAPLIGSDFTETQMMIVADALVRGGRVERMDWLNRELRERKAWK